ncbi:TonB-dependent receptor [Asticcacaulis sp. W401b]|uniref:TonB-dependent receptor n=1 Tax=Asticcacaulis sp. W401b TaxID=3388666 RepID=UPI003970EE80
MLYDRTLVKDRRSRAVSGVYSDTDAIGLLLKGTGLTFRLTDRGVILIVADTSKPKPSSPPLDFKDYRVSVDDGMRQEAPVVEVVVRGFRGSLNQALLIKRRSAGTVDAILAEDVAKFPNTNLAEAMQRIPAVTLIVGDGGEGRNITVRGLGPMFSRVRINGMEAASRTGASDKFGPNNNARSFDFNVFSADIFSSLIVSKSASSDVEEGSLGATVDLHVPKPLDLPEEQMLSASFRASRNGVSQSIDPRVSVLFSRKLASGRLGVLSSLSYQEGRTREVGYSAADVLSAGLSGNGIGEGLAAQPFCTPLGYVPVAPDPLIYAAKGATATQCSTGNPRTGTLEAYGRIMAQRAAVAPDTPASGAYFPRLPRFLNSTQREKRAAATLSVQYRPDEATDLSLDLIFTRYENRRQDNYIEALSFARAITSNGQPMVSVKVVDFTPTGSLLYGVFDGVDVRSEGLTDVFSTTFSHAALTFRRRVSPGFEVSGLMGASDTTYNNPLRLQLYMDAIDTSDFAIDFRGDNRAPPILSFGGLDVDDVSDFTFAPALSDGTVRGGFSTQGKPLVNRSLNRTLVVNGRWGADEGLKLKAGFEVRQERFSTRALNLVPSQMTVDAPLDLSRLTTRVQGLDKAWGYGAPASWVAIDPERWAAAVKMDAFRYCATECGASAGQVSETTSAIYAMAIFDTAKTFTFPVRGNFGVRYFQTAQSAAGYIPVATPAGSEYPTTGIRHATERVYDGWLPSANVVIDLDPELLLRLSAAKVISRPDLYFLMPGASVNPVPRLGIITNPDLKPIRATTLDLSLEWYFARNSIVSIGLFHKNISDYIQRVNTQVPFHQLGLPVEILRNSNALSSDVFTITRVVNTAGGPLTGIELNLQADLEFLPGVWRHFGFMANYTRSWSRIDYALSSADGKTTSTVTADLIGLSRNSASATVFYEDDSMSFRLVGTYKSRYIRSIPASIGSDLQGNAPTVFLDASAAYALTSRVKIFIEAQNLTDELNEQYIDSGRRDVVYSTRSGRTVSVGATVKF